MVTPPSTAARVSRLRFLVERTFVSNMGVRIEDAWKHNLARRGVDVLRLAGKIVANGGDLAVRNANVGINEANPRDD